VPPAGNAGSSAGSFSTVASIMLILSSSQMSGFSASDLVSSSALVFERNMQMRARAPHACTFDLLSVFSTVVLRPELV